MLEVAVCDDGVGLQLGAGTGHGLSNTRSRLEAAYGPHAALAIENRPDGGVRAALLLPFAPVPRRSPRSEHRRRLRKSSYFSETRPARGELCKRSHAPGTA